MSDTTTGTQLADLPTRERLLVAAETMLVERSWPTLTMADVGAVAGVSRQTVYNEFGTKVGLGEQLALRVASRVLVAVHAALTEHDELRDALAAAVTRALRLAEEEPLVEAVLTGARADADSLLPFLTTRSGPILEMAAQAVAAMVLERWHGLPDDEVRLLADAAVRLIVSQITQPGGSAEQVGAEVAWMLTRVVGRTGLEEPPPSPAGTGT